MPIFGPNVKKMRQSQDRIGLAKALQHRNSNIRGEALVALGELGFFQELCAALGSEFPDVSLRSLAYLEKSDAPERHSELIRALIKGKDDYIQEKVIQVLRFDADSDAIVWLDVGKQLLSSGSERISLLCFNEATKNDADSIESIIELLDDHGLGDRALQFSEKLNQSHPDIASNWAIEARLLYRLGRFDKAIDRCQKALELDPQHEAATRTLGAVYTQLARSESRSNVAEAFDYLTNAVALIPSSWSVKRARGLHFKLLPISDDWREVKQQAEAAILSWGEIVEGSNAIPLLREMYSAYQGRKGLEMTWSEDENRVQIRNINRASDVRESSHWVELSVEGTSHGILLSMTMELSDLLKSQLADRSAIALWSERVLDYSFQVLVNASEFIAEIDENVLDECFQYLLDPWGNGTKPSIATRS